MGGFVPQITVQTPMSTAFKHSLMLHWFADLMNVTEEVTIHRPNVSTLLSSAFIRGDLNAATRGPSFISLGFLQVVIALIHKICNVRVQQRNRKASGPACSYWSMGFGNL